MSKIHAVINSRIFWWGLIIIYPFLWIWQGGDLTDAGFFTSRYFFFWDFLRQGDLHGITLLSDLIGGLFMLMVPYYIGLKLLYVVIILFCTYCSFKILSKYFEISVLFFLALFVGMTLMIRHSLMVFSYDLLSFLFLSITALSLLNGISKNRESLIVISGATSAFACLARLPSVSIFVLVIFSFGVYYLLVPEIDRKNKIRSLLKNSSFYLLGGGLGFFIFYIILQLTGTLEFFMDDVIQWFAKFSDTTDVGYSSTGLISMYVKELKLFLPYFGLFVLLIVSSGFTWFKKKRRLHYIPYILIFVFGIFFIYQGLNYRNPIKFFIAAPPVIAILVIGGYKKNHRYLLPALLLVSISLAQVAGSGTGLFLKLSYGMLFLFPFSVLFLMQSGGHRILDRSLSFRMPTIITIFVIGFVSMIIRFSYIYHVNSGFTARIYARHPINNPLLKGILTTPERAIYIEKAVADIQQINDNNTTLLVYGHKAMLYYLSNTLPAHKTIWLKNNVISPTDLFTSCYQNALNNAKWPIIMDTKENVMGDIGQNLLTKFIVENDYRLVVEDDEYNIYKRFSESIEEL